jgi:hypothetical protein
MGEQEEELKTEFPNLFFDPSESRGDIHLRGGGGRFVPPQTFEFWNVTKIH